MFYFYSTKQTNENASYHRGLLFEDLIREFLRSSGYVVEVTRQKHHSLEYDISGRHEIDGRNVVGEAKAHAETVSGSHVAAFVGKSLPFLCRDDPYTGLFLTTSALSPEAEDYLRSISETTPYKIVQLCGSELEKRMRSALKFPAHDHAASAASHAIPSQASQHLLHTDRGTFIVVTGASKVSAFDDRLALVSRQGTLVTDKELLFSMRKGIVAFQELEPAIEVERDQVSNESRTLREVPLGLITGADWFDYRKPAGPKYFVGRHEAIQRTRKLVDTAASGAIIELKARSGVGKSSVLAMLEEEFKASGFVVELHDARDAHSASDVLSLIQRFTGVGQRLESFEQIPAALNHLQTSLVLSRGVFMVDQFESVFSNPEVFYAYEYIALCIARIGNGEMTMIFARKDDLLTTHDEIEVNLGRLRALAMPISLEDFTRVEALELLNQTAKAFPKRLTPKILSQVLEFAQGFPWLLKRTMSHVVGMINNGANQQEMLSSGLHLEDLFEEELAELDEHERGYLTRLAAALPATYQVLARRFEDDPFLRPMLEQLTARRLLRFSAGTYDTYNDVFKDFLLYERLPERSASEMFRTGLVPVMKTFRSLGAQNRIDPEEFGAKIGKSLGGTYNILRELKLAGLVNRTPTGWFVPDVVRQFEHQGRLGEFVRQSILKIKAVADFLSALGQGKMSRYEIANFLRHNFPFVEAKDEVWDSYVRTFLDWLVRLKWIELEKEGGCRLLESDKDAVLNELGNLHVSGRPIRSRDEPFVPMRDWSTLVRVWTMASMKPIRRKDLRASDHNAAGELLRLGGLRKRDDGLLEVALPVDGLENRVRTMLQQQPYTSFWTNVRQGMRLSAALEKSFSLPTLSPKTRNFTAKKLVNWGKHFGLLPKHGYAGRESSQEDLFNESSGNP